jgi:hypothetical protein
MSVLYLTIFVSVMLAVFFVAGFVYHHLCSGGDPMRDSLLPFKKEKTNPVCAAVSRESKDIS